MNDLARQTYSATRQAYDPRADFKSRTIHLSISQIAIERVMDGIKMHIAVPVSAYQCLRIRVQAPHGLAVLTLTHEDADLNVELASGEATEIAIAAKAWAAVFEKPLSVEPGVTFEAPLAREHDRPKPSRRSRFAHRRKLGLLDRLQISFAGEREIIARN